MVPPHSGPLTLTAKLNIVEHLPSGSDFLGSAASLFFVDVIFFSMVSRFFLRRETKARGSVTVAKHQQKLVEVSNFWHCSTGASVIKDRCTRNSSLFFSLTPRGSGFFSSSPLVRFRFLRCRVCLLAPFLGVFSCSPPGQDTSGVGDRLLSPTTEHQE